MRRRQFITLLGGAAATLWPPAARGQQPMPVIGFLNTASSGEFLPFVVAFRQGLKEAGYSEGQNVLIEYRWAENQHDRLPTLAADLVRYQVGVIFAAGNPDSALVAKAATSTIPIVFANGADPIKFGLVAGLNRPGGNVTGVSFLFAALGQKKLELLHEMAPKAAIIGVLLNPTNSNAENQASDLQTAARTLGLRLHVLHASAERDFDSLFANLLQLRVGALVIGPMHSSTIGSISSSRWRHVTPSRRSTHGAKPLRLAA